MDKKLKLTFINVENDPRAGGGRTIISVRIDDGNTELGPYVKAFSLVNPSDGTIFTEEQILDLLAEQDLTRPKDPWQTVKAMQADGKQREITLPKSIKNE